MLGKRDPEHYGTLTLIELEVRIRHWARQLGLEASFFQTNSEGEFVERLHQAPELADALLLNPGAWTHYSYAIRDALEIAGLPTVEVHLSDVDAREEWRRHSVLADLVLGTRLRQGRRRLPGGARAARATSSASSPPTRHERVRGPGAAARALRRASASSTCCSSPTSSTSATCAASPARTASAWSVRERAHLRDRLPLRRAREVGGARLRARAGAGRTCSSEVAELVEASSAAALRLGFDDAHMTVAPRAARRSCCPSGVELVPAGGLVEELRAVKDERRAGRDPRGRRRSPTASTAG